jgi:hypothetical protein
LGIGPNRDDWSQCRNEQRHLRGKTVEQLAHRDWRPSAPLSVLPDDVDHRCCIGLDERYEHVIGSDDRYAVGPTRPGEVLQVEGDDLCRPFHLRQLPCCGEHMPVLRLIRHHPHMSLPVLDECIRERQFDGLQQPRRLSGRKPPLRLQVAAHFVENLAGPRQSQQPGLAAAEKQVTEPLGKQNAGIEEDAHRNALPLERCVTSRLLGNLFQLIERCPAF